MATYCICSSSNKHSFRLLSCQALCWSYWVTTGEKDRLTNYKMFLILPWENQGGFMEELILEYRSQATSSTSPLNYTLTKIFHFG